MQSDDNNNATINAVDFDLNLRMGSNDSSVSLVEALPVVPCNLIDAQVKVVNDRVFDYYEGLDGSTQGAAGMDLRAMIDQPLDLEPGQCELIGSGLAIWLNNPQFAGFLIPRSGLGHKHGIVVGNLTGLIDSDYQGEIFISCWNRSGKTYRVEPGEKIAQLVIQPVFKINPVLVEQFESETARGAGGFGHTGKF